MGDGGARELKPEADTAAPSPLSERDGWVESGMVVYDVVSVSC